MMSPSEEVRTNRIFLAMRRDFGCFLDVSHCKESLKAGKEALSCAKTRKVTLLTDEIFCFFADNIGRCFFVDSRIGDTL